MTLGARGTSGTPGGSPATGPAAGIRRARCCGNDQINLGGAVLRSALGFSEGRVRIVEKLQTGVSQGEGSDDFCEERHAQQIRRWACPPHPAAVRLQFGVNGLVGLTLLTALGCFLFPVIVETPLSVWEWIYDHRILIAVAIGAAVAVDHMGLAYRLRQRARTARS